MVGGVGPVPLLGPTLANRTQFISSNAAQARTPYKPLNIYWTCDVVTFRFEITFEPQPVLGITILETTPAPEGNEFPFIITQGIEIVLRAVLPILTLTFLPVYAELNAAAFLIDIGAKVTPPPPPPTK